VFVQIKPIKIDGINDEGVFIDTLILTIFISAIVSDN